MVNISIKSGYIFVNCPNFDMRARGAPDRAFDKETRSWKMPLILATAKYILNNYTDNEIPPAVKSELVEMKANAAKSLGKRFPSWFKFKNEPMKHQMDAFHSMWGLKEYALFMEMGTGKTFCAVNWSAAMVMDNQADQMLVICPTAVKPVWMHEIKTHCPIDADFHVLEAGGKKAFENWMQPTEEDKGMKVLIVGIEALSQGGAYDICVTFVLANRTLATIDESSRIKTHSATRTKRCVELGAACKARLILTGTPVTQGMQDLYSQFMFLNPKIIGQRSYFAFQNRYCVMGGFEGRKIIGYNNVGELMDNIAPNTFIVKKEDVLDLPPKVYESIVVQPNKEQARILKDLGDKYIMAAEMGDVSIEVETILERMTRYQQVVGGLFPYELEEGGYGVKRITGKNPKLEAMCEMIDDMDHCKKVIIWARFKEEQNMIAEYLQDKYGISSLAWFNADSTTAERSKMIERFQHENSKCRFFLSNPTMGGIGLTLTAAEYMFYYSNSFSLEDRLQSEDRAHRKGQTKSVTYVDIMMDHQIDRDIVKALKLKKSVADYVEENIRAAQ